MCGTCGRVINKGEYYYRYKSRYKEYGWITPVGGIYCRSCGDKERQMEERIAEQTPRIILKSLLLYFIGCVIAYFVFSPQGVGFALIAGALFVLPLMLLALLFKVL